MLFASNVTAQTITRAQPIQCVRRDTVIWTLPTNNCGGAFVNYTIYAARNLNGPYQILTTITNINTQRFFHSAANNELWYYYIESRYQCAVAATQINRSDTIDNIPPALNPLVAASVLPLNAGVELTWRRNTSSRVTGYVIYKKTNIGLVPYDTVRGRDSIRYVDRRATPTTKSESYQVLAIDDCGNTSLFDELHNTIFLQTVQSKCQQTLTLKWSRYDAWTLPQAVDRYEIWIGVNGRNPYLFQTLLAADTQYIIRNLNDGDRYQCYIRAVQAQTNVTTRSNVKTDTLNLIQPVRVLALKNVTVNTRNQTQLAWIWSRTAKIDSVYIMRGDSVDSIKRVKRYKPIAPFDDEVLYLDSSTLAGKGPQYYRVQTKDECDTVVTSNYAATIFLSAKVGNNRMNELTWTPFILPRATVLEYQIYRFIDGAPEVVGNTRDINARIYKDDVLSTEANICYIVAARYRYTLPDNSIDEALSYSNTACAAQFASFFVPNAFTPDGKNPEFKPVISFADNVASYSMNIFDRYGGLIFTTDKLDIGWDGRRGSTLMPTGSYSYSIKLTQKDGTGTVRSGVLLLLR